MRKREKYLSVVVITALSAFTIAGCGKDKPKVENKELVVLCGNSFVKPMKQLCDEFTTKTGVKIITTSAGSENLLPMIKVGQKGDLFITHDPYLDYVSEAGMLADHIHVGFVAPVLAVQKGNPRGVLAIKDLTQAGLKVGLTDPEYSTCGEMVFQLLEKKGIKNAVMENVGNRLMRGHSDVGNLLKTETVDAVIMWNGVAHTFGDSLEIVPTPYEYDEEIRVHIMGLNFSKRPDLLKKFLEFAHNRGEAVFTQHGYVK
jgi:molybdate transport system substrate-binding protein